MLFCMFILYPASSLLQETRLDLVASEEHGVDNTELDIERKAKLMKLETEIEKACQDEDYDRAGQC